MLKRSRLWTGFPWMFVPALALAAPGTELTGTWEGQLGGQTILLVLRADGGGSLMENGLRWAVNESQLEATIEGETIAFDFVLEGDRLTLSGDEMPEPVLFVRSATGSAAAPAPEPAGAAADGDIVGKWRAPNEAVLEFKPDGSAANAQGAFHYVASEGFLYVVENQLLLQYRIEGSRLEIRADGEVIALERARDDAALSPLGKARASQEVLVNGTKLTPEQVGRFEAQHNVRILGGAYWYDKDCGAWGLHGGPALGFLPARRALGGPLRADASGNYPTGVFINGRQIHPQDLAALQAITPVVPGRYWVDAVGNCGTEGNPTPLANLVQLAQAARSRQGSSYTSRSDLTGIGTGGDGRTSYVMGKDWSVIVGE